MGQKDLAQNDYLNDKVRFADMCNGILFHGEEIVKPEELQETGEDIVYQEERRRRKVIPIVIYYGTDKRWDGATCLYDMLDMDKELEAYILNYKINLFDYHDYKDFSMFKTENRELFEVLSCAKDKAAMDVLIHENVKRYEKLSYDAAQLICDIAGIEIELVKEVEQDGREVADMCKAWDDHKRDGIEEGIKEGIKVFVEDKIEDGIPVNCTL